ncbi:hypothetical protein BGX30_007610 [Mortierella sp. GBA39]|nr:hypothetical protein BGX30_007610 [Mortierella sp. GBA39]
MSNETTYNNNNAELPTLQQMDTNATDAFVVTSSSSSAPISEDIEMADQDLGDPSPSMDDHPISAGQEPDLRFFSIMSDSDYNGNVDLKTDLQDVLLSKRHSLAQ